MEHASEFRSLRAPAGDGQTLVEPTLAALPDVVAQNRERMAHADYDVQGCSLADLSASARRALVERAVAYTAQYRNVPDRWRHADRVHDAPFVLSGHQPELFHPGVWYKNFVLGALARQIDGVGVHLLIDSDMCRSVSIRVPTGTTAEPRVEAVAYDAPEEEVPYEERSIRDSATFSSFSERVLSLIRPWISDPLVTSLWPLTGERNPHERNLGLRLAQGRHALEETWRSETLELPQSAVCQLPEFAWFVAHLLAHLPRFWSAYNDSLAAYRRAHRMRNRAQPVPDLAESDGWLEAPFWIWSADDPERRPLFARQSGDELILTDRNARTFRLNLTGDRDVAAAAEQLMEHSSRGVKIRTRALTTTLFARLVLCDLFLHGIGGAKYDQVTDQIIQSFFGFAPPEFATVSATLRLPVGQITVEPLHDGHWQQKFHELQYHPERFIEADRAASEPSQSKATQIIAAKRRWLQTPKTPQNARERHAGITTANEALQAYVADMRRRIETDRDESVQRNRAEAIVRSREYSFCLYPGRHFEKLLADLPISA